MYGISIDTGMLRRRCRPPIKLRAILRMTLVPRGSGSVDPGSPLRGASLALSGMAGLIPCIPPSARESAAGDPLGIFLQLGQDCDEREDLILEDNCCPGVSGLFLHDPGQAYPFMECSEVRCT